MKKLLPISLVVFLAGCSEFFPNDGRFLVDDINLTSDRTKAIYRLSPIKGRGYTYYIDSIGKLFIGDTMILKAKYN